MPIESKKCWNKGRLKMRPVNFQVNKILVSDPRIDLAERFSDRHMVAW